MKKNLIHSIIIFFIFMIVILNLNGDKVQESIIYFPIDPNVSFQTANTSLNLVEQPQKDQYIVRWKIASTLERKAYLRQDIGLLFSNGKLVDGLGKWIENSRTINQEKKIPSQESAIFQAITFHHAELHEQENKIYSAQTMSADKLYVIQTPFTPLISFKKPESSLEKEWEERLNQKTSQFLQSSWEKGIKAYSINLGKYRIYPLTEFYFKSNIVPGFSKEESGKLIGTLWEGLYKNYFLGIKKADGTIENAIGSTIPLILISKDKSHIIVLTETTKGEPIILQQKIEHSY
ncbi:MAG: hypothetical protein Q8934_11525 [Bacillota bacterium]|nr:hypothetical protein [Bacillota bacterium]